MRGVGDRERLGSVAVGVHAADARPPLGARQGAAAWAAFILFGGAEPGRIAGAAMVRNHQIAARKRGAEHIQKRVERRTAFSRTAGDQPDLTGRHPAGRRELSDEELHGARVRIVRPERRTMGGAEASRQARQGGVRARRELVPRDRDAASHHSDQTTKGQPGAGAADGLRHV